MLMPWWWNWITTFGGFFRTHAEDRLVRRNRTRAEVPVSVPTPTILAPRQLPGRVTAEWLRGEREQLLEVLLGKAIYPANYPTELGIRLRDQDLIRIVRNLPIAEQLQIGFTALYLIQVGLCATLSVYAEEHERLFESQVQFCDWCCNPKRASQLQGKQVLFAGMWCLGVFYQDGGASLGIHIPIRFLRDETILTFCPDAKHF